jgi:hypothetical protein
MKTMLDKCAVAGDITQAIDRRGAWTCAIVIAGGTESTAVKLQSCDTADGSFSDFKTLIPASEAEADQYKGFVIDLDGAKKFIKVTGATMATCVLGDCDVDVKQVAIKAGEIPSGADLENNKTATIDVSTYTEPVEIEPTDGKDGKKKATVTLSNIPSGGDDSVYIWLANSKPVYLNIDIAPSADDAGGMKVLQGKASDGLIPIGVPDDSVYTYVSDTEFILTFTEGDVTQTITYTRDNNAHIWD